VLIDGAVDGAEAGEVRHGTKIYLFGFCFVVYAMFGGKGFKTLSYNFSAAMTRGMPPS
jgi:hypothetical protein